ncbi:MAG TPA: EF-P lysine aminoacylase EpmA [Polyangia bacterium]
MDERSRLSARTPALLARAAILRAVRSYFETQGFLEVETPARVMSPGQELHLDAIPADRGRHLITSPEYHMKRLVAGGLPRIVQFCRCFRAEEDGPFHQPEFTMIEWYRAGGTMDELMRDCEAIVEVAARAAGTWPRAWVPTNRRSEHSSEVLALDGTFERTTVRDLFHRHAGFDLRGDENQVEMRALALRAGCHVGAAAWDDVFYQVFLDRIEAHLGCQRPTFVLDWPVPLGALARRKVDDPLTVERFELYAGGLELANAFGELTDPVEQRSRFVAEAELRRQRGRAVYPIDEKLLAALGHMPPTCGIALGFDRLVMLVLGASSIRDVLAFAHDEA